MKHYLLAALLAATTPALAQDVPGKNAATIIIHTPDSAQTAYRQVVRGFLSNGYGIDRKDNDAMFISTPLKSTDGVLYIKLQAVSMADASGSNTTFQATFSVKNAATMAARMENKEMPVRYTGPGTNPMKRAWAELDRIAATSLPGGRVEYK
jgi:hypothetical protein